MGMLSKYDGSSVLMGVSVVVVWLLVGCSELSPLQPGEEVFVPTDENGPGQNETIETSGTTGLDLVGHPNVVGNDFPVVLVHGAFGWGRDEVGGAFGHYYWGGYDDLQELMRAEGHETHTASVGPLSSNWDRACELYAQIVGKKTDYGLAHATEHDHARFGRDFTGIGLVEAWGSPGMHAKINFIAHSMGAQTVGMLAQLLENGFPGEQAADYSGQEEISELFDPLQDTRNLIHSLMTVAGSHNGSTLANELKELVPIVEELVVGALAFVGMDSNNTVANVYDVKLDQFGLTPRQPGESLHAYFQRIAEAADGFLNGERKDICLWDLSPEGAAEQNAWVHAQDNIYYLSYSVGSTMASPLPALLDNGEHHQLPQAHTIPAFMATAAMLGRYTCGDDRYHGLVRARDGQFYGLSLDERVRIDSAWWENDGVVNTVSQAGPWLYRAGYTGLEDVIVAWDDTTLPLKGVWNDGGTFRGIDHLDATGLELMVADIHGTADVEHIEDWYLERARFLKTLP